MTIDGAMGCDVPILKIGAVVVRRLASKEGVLTVGLDHYSVHHASKGMDVLNDDPHTPAVVGPTTDESRLATTQILILQPIPKRLGEVPAFVLPRGSRQYQDEAGAWHDARDVATGKRHVATLEPFTRALAREVEEEAGVTTAMLARATVHALGALPFQSRTKGVYPIYWFVVMLDAADAAVLTDTVPADALAVRWATRDTVNAMAEAGTFSAGYLPVIDAALGFVA